MALQNYQLKSGEGLSVLFVVVWLLGDLCNLFGAILAGLLPTVIILALYVSICISFTPKA
jgi:solute carrier family 66 (lysosomal lysine-arginine transporter), member 1